MWFCQICSYLNVMFSVSVQRQKSLGVDRMACCSAYHLIRCYSHQPRLPFVWLISSFILHSLAVIGKQSDCNWLQTPRTFQDHSHAVLKTMSMGFTYRLLCLNEMLCVWFATSQLCFGIFILDLTDFTRSENSKGLLHHFRF